MLKFSVIVPVYKAENYLSICIESVLAQTYTNFELILVDDGSPDNCPKICDDYKLKDNRVVVIHKINSGASSSRNVGIKIAKGDYIMFLDSDDFWDINILGFLSSIIEETHKDVYLGNSRFDYYTDHVVKCELFCMDEYKNKNYTELIHAFFKGMMPTASWHNVYSKKFLIDNKILFNEKLTWSEDADLFYNILFSTKSIGLFGYTFYYYRKNNQSAMTKNPSLKHYLSQMYVIKTWFYKIQTLDLSAVTKRVIMNRFANAWIHAIIGINFLSEEEANIVSNKIMTEKEMLQCINSYECKLLLTLSKIIGCRKTSLIINHIKNIYLKLKAIK